MIEAFCYSFPKSNLPKGGYRYGDTVTVSENRSFLAHVKAMKEAVSAPNMGPAKQAKDALQEEARGRSHPWKCSSRQTSPSRAIHPGSYLHTRQVKSRTGDGVGPRVQILFSWHYIMAFHVS